MSKEEQRPLIKDEKEKDYGCHIVCCVISGTGLVVFSLFAFTQYPKHHDFGDSCVNFINLPPGYTLDNIQIKGGVGCTDASNKDVTCPQELTANNPEVCIKLNYDNTQQNWATLDANVMDDQGNYVEHITLNFSKHNVDGTYQPAGAAEPLNLPAGSITYGTDGNPTTVTLPDVNAAQKIKTVAAESWSTRFNKMANNTYDAISKGFEHLAHGVIQAANTGAKNFVGNAAQIGTLSASTAIGVLAAQSNNSGAGLTASTPVDISFAGTNPADNFSLGTSTAALAGAAVVTLGLAGLGLLGLRQYHKTSAENVVTEDNMEQTEEMEKLEAGQSPSNPFQK